MNNAPQRTASAAARNASSARRAKPARTHNVSLVDTPEHKALKALTGRVLESLKNPNAVPSTVILAALKEARTL